MSLLHGTTALTHLGVIRALGPEAASFLHTQLTQEIEKLSATQAPLAAYCSPQGRMLASFIVLKTAPEEVLLICAKDLLATLLAKLKMFVLRAKVQLSDASADYGLYGVVGDALSSLSTNTPTPWQRVDIASDQHLVFLYPANEQARGLYIGPTTQTMNADLPMEHWLWSEVRSGVATIQAATAGQFVPQMLNYESVDGVNFKKGCYPGQEVVARSQYRGTLKRRAYLAHSTQPLAPSAEIFSSADASQPCGVVVQAAATPQGGFDAIVCLQTSAASQTDLQTSAQAPLRVEAMPYPLRVEE